MKEQWDVIEEIDFGQREDCPYWRGVMIYYHSFFGSCAQEKAEKQAIILRAQNKNILVKKADDKPIHRCLPYQKIARRVLK